MGKKEGIRKFKRSTSIIQKKNRGRSKKTGEDRQGRGKRLQKRRVTRKVHGEDVVWVE